MADDATNNATALPGTKHVQCSFDSRSTGGGKCCYEALGNSMQNAGVLFPPKSRNLKSQVIKVIVKEIKENPAVKAAMEAAPGRWQTKQMQTVEDFCKEMQGPSTKAGWGGANHIQIMATAIERIVKLKEKEGDDTALPRVIVHTKNTNTYQQYLPIPGAQQLPTTADDSEKKAKKDHDDDRRRPNKRQRLSQQQWVRKIIHAGDVLPTDIVVIFSGCHWSPTKYDAQVPRADLLVEEEEEEKAAFCQEGGTADAPIEL